MGATSSDGPFFTYGNMAAVLAATFGFAVPDPNVDAGPNGGFQGDGFLDCRYLFQKDKIQGYTGIQPGHFSMPYVRGSGQIPAALAANNICAAQGVTSGVAMTLATASTGVAVNIPIIPFSAAINGSAPVTVGLALDFGFEFGNVTSGNATITVANAADFFIGMPLVIAGCGNAAGTVPLLCNVTAINTATPSITVNATPLATVNPTPIGTGNIWGPSEAWYNTANQIPTAALPWLAAGPGLWLDPRQAICRGVQIVGPSGGVGGTFTVRGYDIYNQPMSCAIVVAAGSNTVYGTKAFKYIVSVTPNFTDASHNYTVGTSDLLGLNYFAQLWDDVDVAWGGTYMSTSTGFVAGVTGTASATTGDVRGTIQVSSSGPTGNYIPTTGATNGTVSSLAMSGRRFTAAQTIPLYLATQAFPNNAVSVFGSTQV